MANEEGDVCLFQMMSLTVNCQMIVLDTHNERDDRALFAIQSLGIVLWCDFAQKECEFYLSVKFFRGGMNNLWKQLKESD